jgi:hypothetical protein
MIQQPMVPSLAQSFSTWMMQWARPKSVINNVNNVTALPQRRAQPVLATALPRLEMLEPQQPKLCIRRHPSDLRRTVISGRFADVCAALEGLAAAELEAA